MGEALKIFIGAGEASGDMHAAALMRALKAQLAPRGVVFRGFGGPAMREEGAELLFHTDQTAIMGITPVLKNLPFLLRMKRTLQREMLAWRPDLVLTVDYPGMNLRLAAFAKARGFRTAHYICPQVWAWHRGRIPKIAKTLDALLCIFPFEPPLFSATPLRPVFVGHPLVERAEETRQKPAPALPWGKGRHRVALLPGSRAGEIRRILPRMLAAAEMLSPKLAGGCAFVIPAASAGARREIEAVVGTRFGHLKPAVVDGSARDVLAQAECAAVASGTATLEASLMRCPTVLVYAVSSLTYFLGRLLIHGVKFIGLANIIAGREVMPELIQGDFTADELATHLHAYLADASVRAEALRLLDRVNAKLGGPGASARAAKCLVERFLEK